MLPVCTTPTHLFDFFTRQRQVLRVDAQTVSADPEYFLVLPQGPAFQRPGISPGIDTLRPNPYIRQIGDDAPTPQPAVAVTGDGDGSAIALIEIVDPGRAQIGPAEGVGQGFAADAQLLGGLRQAGLAHLDVEGDFDQLLVDVAKFVPVFGSHIWRGTHHSLFGALS